MRIESLSADEFMVALAGIADGVAVIKGSDSGKAFLADVKAYQGSLKGVEEGEREAKAEGFLVDSLLKHLPGFCRENGDAVYSILAACDGQTVEQYKKAFTSAKLVADIKALGAFVAGNLGDVQGFLA